ncbi:hypothetical protein PMIN06_013078 [Paraphaeosphaeria minitans]
MTVSTLGSSRSRRWRYRMYQQLLRLPGAQAEPPEPNATGRGGDENTLPRVLPFLRRLQRPVYEQALVRTQRAQRHARRHLCKRQLAVFTWFESRRLYECHYYKIAVGK